MSRLLSDLLGAREPGFTQQLHRLEDECGQPGVDLYLISDISKKVRQKLRELGLDPSDTTGEELFQALQNLIEIHDGFLSKKLGISKTDKAPEVISQVIKTIKKLPVPQTCWALKHSSAKRLLSKNPPKHVMKQLHYRSIDSLLKRANIDETFAAIYIAESASWRDRFVAAYKNLLPSDFESRPIKVIELNSKRWGDLAEKYIASQHRNLITINELGVVAVLPLPNQVIRGLTITLLPQIIYQINKLRSISSYLKLNQVKPDFNQHFIKAITNKLQNTAQLYGQFVSWDTIHKYFGNGKSNRSEVFSPHIQPEDLQWKQAEDILFKLEPALKFWEGLDYVAAPFAKGPIPLGLQDNSISYCNQLDYGEHSIHFFRIALKRELLVRYMEQPKFEDHIINQFDNSYSETEIFTMIERGLS